MTYLQILARTDLSVAGRRQNVTLVYAAWQELPERPREDEELTAEQEKVLERAAGWVDVTAPPDEGGS